MSRDVGYGGETRGAKGIGKARPEEHGKTGREGGEEDRRDKIEKEERRRRGEEERRGEETGQDRTEHDI